MKKYLQPIGTVLAIALALVALLVVLVQTSVEPPLPAERGTGSITGVTLTTSGSITVTGDVTVNPVANGGNAGAINQISGVPRIKWVSLGDLLTNGSTETTSYTDDSSAGEYAPLDSDVTEGEGSSNGIYRVGASSYKAIFASTAITDDGFSRTITNDDLSSNEFIGGWFYPTVAVAVGDLTARLVDDGGARTGYTNTVALAANTWTWVEFDISGLDGTTGNAVTGFGVVLTGQGAASLGAFTLYMDDVWKWDAADDIDLGVNILPDGVLTGMFITDAASGDHDVEALIAGTDYFVSYKPTGTDYIVIISNRGADSGSVIVAY